jgi:hypothetical protein
VRPGTYLVPNYWTVVLDSHSIKYYTGRVLGELAGARKHIIDRGYCDWFALGVE